MIDSNNPLWEKDEEESYANISVFQDISQYVETLGFVAFVFFRANNCVPRILMPQIRELRELIKPSHTLEGDGTCDRPKFCVCLFLDLSLIGP